MWLTYYFCVFVFMTQLMLNTSASLGRRTSKLWLPYDYIGASFVKDAEEHPIKAGSSASSSRVIKPAGGCWNCFASPQKLDSIRVDENHQRIDYFQAQFKDLLGHHKINMVKKLFHYLLRNKSLPPEALQAWVSTLRHSLSHYQGFSVIRTTVLYGLHTMLLGNLKNMELANSIRNTLDELMRDLTPLDVSPNGLASWEREIFMPTAGLSTELRKWSSLQPMLLNEPRLSSLRMAIQEPTPESIPNDIVLITKEIFSAPPVKDISAETRVAFIALLLHLMHSNFAPVKQCAMDTVQSLISGRHSKFFLFDHELILLQKLSDHRPINLPGGVTILTMTTPPAEII
ncbi:hypothetical protein MJO28_001737 [Puccinia striiformis f. sp. tritici]|uniref:Proteasome activator Blm10 mid region domain-containing protein n=3 Tax=Puccinia striiformis TaxID=27350 RepID=A0A0L0W4J0_9BASI|nr:hypothetical protein Pst134EA_003023 [Puccinia striiformis f. sp. tritici]KNF06436.1 hypothetical protein PSTG_00319 [Puccinia striiformis f. sp. tritici PST-78]POW08977.1 hypothetical protein PSTT_07113 [Puccinia striiformis]KAH9464564.1 hypothetical protein Pst134EB_004091 [Puccinia striiformis f. sp. tritici]KAH9472407.1 hypothetical protein Pst134EA_003023 [Puccinia striiformis f. sp. tritici]KAI7961248.1 hypothetical protein MJO28_001737 [Puccinia striiformis f. sp. tritici]